MDVDLKKRQVNFEQLTELLEFLKEHQELAKGLARGRRGKFHTLKVWNQCAKKLNSVKDGAVKDGKGWSKYWCDWKYRVRRRALEIKAAKDHNRPMPESTVPLSPMEENILSIIGEHAVEGVMIKSDPLEDGETDNEDHETTDHNDDVTLNQYYEATTRSKRKRKRRNSSNGTDLDNHAGPSSPAEPDRKHDRNGDLDSDRDDDASEFLRLEKEKLQNSRRVADSLQTIRTELTRLADIMGDIRDCLVNRINV